MGDFSLYRDLHHRGLWMIFLFIGIGIIGGS